MNWSRAFLAGIVTLAGTGPIIGVASGQTTEVFGLVDFVDGANLPLAEGRVTIHVEGTEFGEGKLPLPVAEVPAEQAAKLLANTAGWGVVGVRRDADSMPRTFVTLLPRDILRIKPELRKRAVDEAWERRGDVPFTLIVYDATRARAPSIQKMESIESVRKSMVAFSGPRPARFVAFNGILAVALGEPDVAQRRQQVLGRHLEMMSASISRAVDEKSAPDALKIGEDLGAKTISLFRQLEAECLMDDPLKIYEVDWRGEPRAERGDAAVADGRRQCRATGVIHYESGSGRTGRWQYLYGVRHRDSWQRCGRFLRRTYRTRVGMVASGLADDGHAATRQKVL